MIKLLRIDDRLIHGQVAVYMVKATAADTIVVASDQHATNSVLKMSLTVGKPAGVKMEVLTVEKAISYLNDISKLGVNVYAQDTPSKESLDINQINQKF